MMVNDVTSSAVVVVVVVLIVVVVVVGVVVGDDGASHCVNNVVTIGSDIGVVIVGEVVDSVALVRM